MIFSNRITLAFGVLVADSGALGRIAGGLDDLEWLVFLEAIDSTVHRVRSFLCFADG